MMKMDIKIKRKLVFEVSCSQFTEGKILNFMFPITQKGGSI